MANLSAIIAKFLSIYDAIIMQCFHNLPIRENYKNVCKLLLYKIKWLIEIKYENIETTWGDIGKICLKSQHHLF